MKKLIAVGLAVVSLVAQVSADCCNAFNLGSAPPANSKCSDCRADDTSCNYQKGPPKSCNGEWDEAETITLPVCQKSDPCNVNAYCTNSENAADKEPCCSRYYCALVANPGPLDAKCKKGAAMLDGNNQPLKSYRVKGANGSCDNCPYEPSPCP